VTTGVGSTRWGRSLVNRKRAAFLPSTGAEINTFEHCGLRRKWRRELKENERSFLVTNLMLKSK